MQPRNFRRGLIVLLLAVLVVLLWLARNPEAIVTLMPFPGVAVEPTLGPTPPSPTITAPRGALPSGHAGLEAWAHSADGATQRAGSGFLLQLAEGEMVGVMTAHSLDWTASPQRITFHLPQQSRAAIEFDPRLGVVGRAFTGYRFDVDFVLLRAAITGDAALVLQPDPRGGPLPGERVVLFSGNGDGDGNPLALHGTVTAASDEAVWAQMDEVSDPANMSGSPLLSAHTGQVVGMAVAATRHTPIRIGFHPIGSIVEKAAAASWFP